MASSIRPEQTINGRDPSAKIVTQIFAAESRHKADSSVATSDRPQLSGCCDCNVMKPSVDMLNRGHTVIVVEVFRTVRSY